MQAASNEFLAAFAALQQSQEALAKGGKGEAVPHHGMGYSGLRPATQLHHTPSDSRPSSWAGSGERNLDPNNDGIDASGMNYSGVRKALGQKSVRKGLTAAEALLVAGDPTLGNPIALLHGEILKAQQEGRQATLTQGEQWALNHWDAVTKGGTVPAEVGAAELDALLAQQAGHLQFQAPQVPQFPPMTAPVPPQLVKGQFGVSLPAQQLPGATLQGGQPLQPVVDQAAMVQAAAAGFQQVTSEIEGLRKSLSEAQANQQAMQTYLAQRADFEDKLTKAMVAMGEQVAGIAGVVGQYAQSPAGPPRSQGLQLIPGGQGQAGYGAPGITTLEKGNPAFGGGGQNIYEGPLRGAAVNVLADLIKGQQAGAIEMDRFENGSNLSPQTEALVKSKLGVA